MKKILAVLFFLFIKHAAAQPLDYWQQHVSYTISGTLIDSIHSFDGKLAVVYTNNSPDTLHEVWFHLYYNAFQPGSMMYERSKVQNDRGIGDKIDHYKRSDWGEQRISGVSDESATHGIEQSQMKLQYEISGTIMKVILSHPLKPHDSTEISMVFFVQIPPLTRRGGWMNADGIKYSMSQWYPKICEYDREGWHHQEYVSREFYGVWGDFDVTMNVPAKFCVGATGQCQYPESVGWGYDQIAKGIKKGKVYPKDMQQDGMLKWQFKASNVHDFAWVAHDYIHEWDTWSDTVTVHCLYKPSEEKYWAEAMPNTIAMLNHHSKKVGWYQYRNFTNTHGGDGGMEYPQLIMDGSPGLGLIMHEGGHQWFYGMIGNNETRYAFLDEGFTEFIEMTGMDATYGRYNELSPYRDSSWLTRMFIPDYDSRRNYYKSYLDIASAGYEEPLTIPHDWFRENANAGQVYFKTLAGLAQLEYVLGDSVFWLGMKEYFRRWHFHHPNLNDFKRAMQDVSGADLDYYFDEWFGSTRTIDYAACGLNSDKQADGTYKTTVELKNKSLGVLPVDLTLHYNDGSTGIATVPLAVNQNLGYKKPEAGRLFFPSWDWVRTSYEGTISTPKEVSWYEIDSSSRMMDLDRGNNIGYHPLLGFIGGTTGRGTGAFLKQYQLMPPIEGSYNVLRPIIWYDQVSHFNLGYGVLFGLARNFSGDLKLVYHTEPVQFVHDNKPNILDHFSEDIRGEYSTKLFGNLTTTSIELRNSYGMLYGGLEFLHRIRPTYLNLGPERTIGMYLRVTLQDSVRQFPVYGGGWDRGLDFCGGGHYSFTSENHLTHFRAGLEIGQTYRDSEYTVKTYPFPVGTYYEESSAHSKIFHSYTSWNMFASQLIPFGSGWSLFLRGNVTLNTGTPPLQKLLYVNGANPAEQDRSVFWKGITSINSHFSDQSHFMMEGGAGTRGYRSVLGVADAVGGVSFDLNVPNPIASWGWLPASVKPLLFFDVGYGSIAHLNTDGKDYLNVLADAGVGFKLNILSWLPWQLQGVTEEYASIPQIGIYFPFLLDNPNDGKPSLAFRFAISLGSAF
ncbi:MAG: M1 family metallopeptidase [bacterium]